MSLNKNYVFELQGESKDKYYSISAYSGANWTVIPAEGGHSFRLKLDTYSGGNWTLIPV